VHAKIEAYQILSQPENINESSVIKIPANKLDKDEVDEAWYQNKLYDVIKRESINDTIYVCLLQDNDEEQLITENYNYFKNDNCSFCSGSIQLPHSKKIVSLPDGQYLITARQKMNYYYFTYTIPASRNEYDFNSFNTEVLTPPPKLQFAIQEF
jgi:hypothetical protein